MDNPMLDEVLARKNKEWMAITLSTEPINFEAAKDAAIRAYQAVGLTPPTKFFHCRSPVEAAKMIAAYSGETKNEAVNGMIYGAHESAWMSFYDTMIELGVKDAEEISPLIDLAKVCGWWSPYPDAVFFQDRPDIISFDENQLLHSETGPAIHYRDGFSVYAWHGQRVTESEWERKINATKG